MRRRILGGIAIIALLGSAVTTAGISAAYASDTTPSLADAASVLSEGDARAIAQRFGHPVVVDSKTTERELVSAQPDGDWPPDWWIRE